MPKKPLFDCDTLYPRIAFYIRVADGYIASDELVEKLAYDSVVREIAPDSKTPFRIAQKAVGLFSAHFTMERTSHGMDRYRQEFTRKRVGDDVCNVWAYRVSNKER